MTTVANKYNQRPTDVPLLINSVTGEIEGHQAPDGRWIPQRWPINVATVAELNELIAAKPAWIAGQEIRVAAEPNGFKRVWNGTDALTVVLPNGSTVTLAGSSNTVISGAVSPTTSNGNAGDYYVNTGNSSVFGPKKSDNTWPYLVNSYGIANATRLDIPPDSTFNASNGFHSNSIWQYNGKIYVPAEAPTSSTCEWIPEKIIPALPGDILSACQCLGGVHSIKPGYTGKALVYTATISGVDTGTDIDYINGSLDSAAIARVQNSADPGTLCYVTGVYDQSGNLFNLTVKTDPVQNNIAKGFFLIWDALLNDWAFAADTSQFANNHNGLFFPAGLTIVENNFTAFFWGRGVYSQAQGSSFIASLGDGAASSTLSLGTGESNGYPSVTFWKGSNPSGLTPATITPLPCSKAIVAYRGYVSSGNKIDVHCNDRSWTGVGNNRTQSAGYLGNWKNTGNNYSAMRFQGFAISNTDEGSARIEKMKKWFYRKSNAQPQAISNVLYVSDSRGLCYDPASGNHTTGQASQTVAVTLQEILDNAGVHCNVINASTGSKTTQDQLSLLASITSINRNAKNVAVVTMGVNNFVVNNESAATALTNLSALITFLKSCGFYVICGELYTTSTGNSANTRLNTLRQSIEAGQSTADDFIVTSDNPIISSPSNALIYYDGLHPTIILSREIARLYAQKVINYFKYA